MDALPVFLVYCFICVYGPNVGSFQPDRGTLNKTMFASLLGIKPSVLSRELSTSATASDYMIELFNNPRAIKGNHVHGFTDISGGTSDKNIRFNVSIPETEDVKFVELLLFKFKPVAALNGSSTISVVDVRTGKRLSTQEVSMATVGWVRFVLPRRFTKRLIRKPRVNKGLELNITSSRLSSLVQFATARTSPSQQPLLVIHCTDRRNPTQDQIVYVPKPRRRIERYARMEGSCRRRKLSLEIKELGWDTWVIVPRRFGVYYCAGSCSDPNSNRIKTIYARMRVMLSERNAVSGEGPCCAPYKLRPMQMLYYGGPGEGTYVLQTMKDMVVVECACR